MRKRIRKKGAWSAPQARKSPSAHRAEGQKAAHKTKAAEKRLPACTPPLTGTPFAGTQQTAESAGGGSGPAKQAAAGRWGGRQVFWLWGKAPYSGGSARESHPASLFSLRRPNRGRAPGARLRNRSASLETALYKPIRKQKASANAFSSVRQNPSLVNENRSALLGIQIEKIPAAAAEF